MTLDEAITEAEVRADALRGKYLRHDPDTTFGDWRYAAGVAEGLRKARAIQRPPLALVPPPATSTEHDDERAAGATPLDATQDT